MNTETIEKSPKAYLLSVDELELIQDYIEDLELKPLIDERLKDEFFEVNLDDL